MLVEDLDKFDREDTSKLFLQHAKTLTMPAQVVYSFPVAMMYTNDFPEISKAFGGCVLSLPNIALKHRDGSDDPEGRARVRRSWRSASLRILSKTESLTG